MGLSYINTIYAGWHPTKDVEQHPTKYLDLCRTASEKIVILCRMASHKELNLCRTVSGKMIILCRMASNKIFRFVQDSVQEKLMVILCRTASHKKFKFVQDSTVSEKMII